MNKLNKDLNCETKFLANSCIFQDLALGKMIGNVEAMLSMCRVVPTQSNESSTNKGMY